MHESETVTDLMSNHILDGLLNHILRKTLCPYTLVKLSSLSESPVVHKLDDVVPHDYRSIDDLACGRVYPRRSHSVRNLRRHITDT